MSNDGSTSESDPAGRGEQHIDGEFSGAVSFDWQLSCEEVEEIYETWEQLVEEHDTIDKAGVVFPDSCLRCDESPVRWQHEIRRYEMGRIVAKLECENCGAQYKQERVV